MPHASKSSRFICSAIPRTRATRRRTPSRSYFAQARAARRTEPLLADERPARDGDPLAAATASETRRELGRCLAELPRAQATVVALKDAFDLGFGEISSATGLPVGTAKCYAHRGRATLRERLSA
jgi:DNA-directed RNA polymerase specialized sigma24 family protein